MAYITCENLLLGYDGVPVAKNVSFTVNEGDYLCIIGENGAGKTTLMKTLLHLTTPLGGSFSMGDGIKAYEIGYLPQQTVVQKDFPASVWEIVMSGTLSKGGFRPFYSKEQKKLAMDNLKRMGIDHLKDECYRNLSGGQQQRVLLARALCAASKILLLDEPVTGLDPKAMTECYQLIASLNEEGIAVIMISHDLHAAVKYASHILHIEPEDSFFGTKEEYLESEEWKQMKQSGGAKHA